MHLLSKAEALAAVRARQALFDAAEASNPFAGSAWTLHFLDEVADDRWTFAMPTSQAGGESLMLWYREPQNLHRWQAVANYYTSLVSPLISNCVAPSDRATAMAQLLQQLVAHSPSCSALRLAPLDADATDTTQLQRAMAALGWYTKRYACFGNWYLPCQGLSFSTYMQGRSSQLLNTWMRRRKKLEQIPHARVEMVTDASQVAYAMDAYESIYAKSWKPTEPYPHFVRNWAHVCAHKHWLRLGLVWLGDTPVAAQFWFTAHGRASIFKLAYDAEHAHLSAGTVLSAHMFAHALDQDHVSEIDYLSGDDGYKAQWMTHRRQRVGLLAHDPWTARGLYASARELAGDISRPMRHGWNGARALLSP